MDRSKYFQQLLKLYEATSVSNVDQHQSNIADTGSDIDDPNVEPKSQEQAMPQEGPAEQPQQEPAPEEQPQEDNSEIGDLNDADYLNSSSASDSPSAGSENQQKLVELFDLFKNLMTYAETFVETLNTVELGLLDAADADKANAYKKSLEKLEKKIRNYLENTFKSEPYERVLYAYILFRTELLTAIKSLRDVLKLNQEDGDDKGGRKQKL